MYLILKKLCIKTVTTSLYMLYHAMYLNVTITCDILSAIKSSVLLSEMILAKSVIKVLYFVAPEFNSSNIKVYVKWYYSTENQSKFIIKSYLVYIIFAVKTEINVPRKAIALVMTKLLKKTTEFAIILPVC